MNSAITAAVTLPLIDRLNDRAVKPCSKVCRQCLGTRRDCKSGGKCTACQGAHGAVLRTKAA